MSRYHAMANLASLSRCQTGLRKACETRRFPRKGIASTRNGCVIVWIFVTSTNSRIHKGKLCPPFSGNRFVAILKQMPMPPVTAIIPDRIAGQQTAHDRGEGSLAGSHQNMGMIGDQRPGKTKGFRLADDLT